MAPNALEARGIRLHPKLWALIDSEAKKARLRPTDFLRRRIESQFGFDPDVPNMHTTVLMPHTREELNDDLSA